MEAAKGRMQDAHDARVHAAWLTAHYAALALAGKLPAEASVLKKAQPAAGATGATIQSKSKMAAQVLMLADYYGIPVRRTH